MLKKFTDAICWLSSHDGAVLVVTPGLARLVDGHHHAEGLSLGAAKSLTTTRAHLFEVSRRGGKTLLTLGEPGEKFHERLVERRRCVCRHIPSSKEAHA
jgi:hypothetical protein